MSTHELRPEHKEILMSLPILKTIDRSGEKPAHFVSAQVRNGSSSSVMFCSKWETEMNKFVDVAVQLRPTNSFLDHSTPRLIL